MSIIKQILYISRKSKEEELEQLLVTLCQLSENNQACDVCAIYKSDDMQNEFLLYTQWSDEKSYDNFIHSDMYKHFEKKSEVLVLKVEVLRLD